MHCAWTRKTRTWGYEVIRGIDEDDPERVIRAFKHPTGLAFVDLNSQVCPTNYIRNLYVLQKLSTSLVMVVVSE